MPYFEERLFPGRREYLQCVRHIAELQRVISVLFLVLMFASVTLIGGCIVGLVYLGSWIRMMRLLQWSRPAMILGAVGMAVPIVNIFVLGIINVRASNALRHAGLRVGFLGVAPENLHILDDRETSR